MHQGAIILLGFIMLVGLLTGIFSGVKVGDTTFIVPFNTFSLDAFMEGELGTFSVFLQRFCSAEFILIICSFTFFSGWCGILGGALLCYRSFLLGLNTTVMVVVFKALGSITAIIFVLPFQICIIVLQSVLIIVASQNARRRSLPFRKCFRQDSIKTVCFFSCAILALCIVESVLLFLFSSKVIFIM